MDSGKEYEKEIVRIIENLRSQGGRIGAWTIDAGDHENLKHLEGGMGTILRGHRMTMRGERQAGAIKFQLPKSLPDGTRLFQEKGKRDERFEHENSILEYLKQRTQNRSILEALDKGADVWTLRNGLEVHVPFFVTEYMSGGNLLYLVRPDWDPFGSKSDQNISRPIKLLKGQEWLNLAYDLCLGLVDLHTNRVIHQDLKPENIMQHNGRYVIVDFGLASYINWSDPGDSPGGTPGWMPPEQMYRVYGDKEAKDSFAENDAYVDVYSVGAILAFAASGSHPWGKALTHKESENFIQILFNHMVSETPHVANLNNSQLKLVLAMMNSNFRLRPSAQECLDRIARMMSPSNSRKREYAKRFGYNSGALPRLPSAKQYAAQNQARVHSQQKFPVKQAQANDWINLYESGTALFKSVIDLFRAYRDWSQQIVQKFQLRRENRIAQKQAQGNLKEAISQFSPRSEPAFDSDENGNPIYPASWADIQMRFYELIDQIGRKQFVIHIESISVTGIFIQGYFESDGSLTVECAADLSVRPKISKQQLDNLLSIGWEPPSRQIPNFIMFLDKTSSNPEKISELFVRTLRDGYLVSVDEVEVS